MSSCSLTFQVVLVCVIVTQWCCIVLIVSTSPHLSSDLGAYLVPIGIDSDSEGRGEDEGLLSPSLLHILRFVEGETNLNESDGGNSVFVDEVFGIATIHGKGDYIVVEDALVGDKYRSFRWAEAKNPKNHLITICTQASLGGVEEIEFQSHAFEGPISVSVFIEEDIPQSIYSLLTFLECKNLRNVAIHLVLQNDKSAYTEPSLHVGMLETYLKQMRFGAQHKKTFCEQADLVSSQAVNYNHNLPYPNNALRNIAVDAAWTDFVIVLDADIVPSMELSNAVRQAILLSSENDISNTVFIIPTYEVRKESTLPSTRNDILEWVSQGKAQPFYKDLCWKCQKHTRYDIWQQDHPNRLLYEVQWKDAFEPFYAVHRKAFIPYDERFKQYGFNRISQVCETHVAGYHFKVLYHAFLMHRGFKVHGKFHPSKEADMKRNKALYLQFQSELRINYPKSSRRCY
eukprot:m.131654 g.131654  ORF g.131654 m.131654 type:complete len:457 (+) comp13076_c0_seq1:156-1526(+)